MAKSATRLHAELIHEISQDQDGNITQIDTSITAPVALTTVTATNVGTSGDAVNQIHANTADIETIQNVSSLTTGTSGNVNIGGSTFQRYEITPDTNADFTINAPAGHDLKIGGTGNGTVSINSSTTISNSVTLASTNTLTMDSTNLANSASTIAVSTSKGFSIKDKTGTTILAGVMLSSSSTLGTQ